MSSDAIYPEAKDPRPFMVREQDIEAAFVEKLRSLKYTHRPDIRDRAALEANFRQKFESLNRVRLTDAEFARLLDDLVSPDVFNSSVRLREKNDFTRDDGTPLSYTLVNIKDWCKNDFEVVHQLRINTPPSPAVETLDFEFVLFASAIIDYDYIMALLARFSHEAPSRQTMNREQLIGLILADAKFLDERDTIRD